MSVLVASDLDRTLIYSRAAAALGGEPVPELVAVERHEGKDSSWMTAAAARMLAQLQRGAVVVPVTTRTPAQLARVDLPGRADAPGPHYAVAANGGVLLVDGSVDRSWRTTVAAALTESAPLAQVWEHAGHVCKPEWTIKLRNADGLFCYAVLHRRRVPAGFLAEAGDWARERGWRMSLQGRKLYWVPVGLTKSAAVAEIARRAGTERTLAAGDSLLDADLLEAADAGIAARHGELAESGWNAPHVEVTRTAGARAGEEIVTWLRAGALTRR